MPLLMTQWTYTSAATAAMAKDPQDRSLGLKKLVEGAGGKLLCCYFCFGDYDGVAIWEAPDNTAAMAVVMAATGPGHLRTVKTTLLVSMAESVGAMNKTKAMVYSGPGD